MAHLLQSLYSAARPEFSYLGRSGQGTTHRQKLTWNRFPVIVRCASTESLTSLTENAAEIELKHLVSQHGWDVRRLNRDDEDEIRRVSLVQAEAFHIPLALFNDFFFMFFQAEVLSALLYKLKNSPPDRYACLMAKQTSEAETCSSSSVVGVVGVVDITAQTESSVLCHFPGVEEYLYVSGLAVSKAQRRKKMGSTLLKACDVLCYLWGFKLLALRAYEDDAAARNLYSNAGYEVVATDPLWTSTWIGRKRRVLMTKRFS